MRTVEGEAGDLAVVELCDRPFVAGMAVRALGTQRATVNIVIGVTRNALGRCVMKAL